MALFGLFNRNKKIDALKNKVTQALLSFGFKYTQYDDNVKNYVEKAYNVNSDVYSVVSQKANEITRIPYYIKRVKNEQLKERYNTYKSYNTPQHLIKRINLETKAFDEDEIPMPLDRPNPQQSWREFFALYETYMDLTGNFYIYLVSPSEGVNAGKPLYMYILPAHLMQIVLKDDIVNISDESPIKEYILTEGNHYIKFEAENVVHIKMPNPNYNMDGSHLYGQSPLRAALNNIQSSNEARELNAKTLANGGSFGFLSTKEPLTPEQAQQLKERLVEMDMSDKRLSNIAGSAKEVVFTRISLTTDELKPFDYLEYDQKQICNVLGWDDKLLNSDDGAKYDNYKQAVKRSINNGVVPNLRLLEDAFNTVILPRFKEYQKAVFMFDENELPEMQEDMGKLTKWLNDALDRGVINRDEYRQAVSYTELETPEMQLHTVSMNVIPLEDIGLTTSEDEFSEI